MPLYALSVWMTLIYGVISHNAVFCYQTFISGADRNLNRLMFVSCDDFFFFCKVFVCMDASSILHFTLLYFVLLIIILFHHQGQIA